MRRSVVTYVITIMGFIFLYIPIIVLLVYSFNDSKLVNIWEGCSLRWYVELVKDKQLINAIETSLQIAICSASLSTAFGLMSGIVFVKLHKFHGRVLLSALLVMPLMMPEVITGFSLLIFFSSIRDWFPSFFSNNSIFTVIIAHSTIGMAYISGMVQNRMLSTNLVLEEAAIDLGARPWKVFFVITLPVLLPSLVAGWLISFVLSLDDMVIASFTSLPGVVTLPMLIYSRIRFGVSPVINALSSVIMVLISVVAIFIAYILRKNKVSLFD
jgi:putrescine transport system permease protein